MSTIPDHGIANTSNASFISILNFMDNNPTALVETTFFDLPNCVRALILKYKGIEKLYGKFHTACYQNSFELIL